MFSIPISCGPSGACACHPVGEHAGIASHDIAFFYLPPAGQPGVISHKFGSSSIKFYLFIHDITRGAYGTKSGCCLAFNNYFLVLVLMILHKAMDPEVEHLHCNLALVDS